MDLVVEEQEFTLKKKKNYPSESFFISNEEENDANMERSSLSAVIRGSIPAGDILITQA